MTPDLQRTHAPVTAPHAPLPRHWIYRLSALALASLLAACASAPSQVSRMSEGHWGPLPSQTSAKPSPVVPHESPTQIEALARSQSMQVEDSLNPGVAVDLQDPNAHTDLWQRVRLGFGMPNLENDLVRKAENWYSARPDYVQRMTERGSRYLFHVVDEVQKRGMPTELALLPFVESAYRTDAKSSAKAVGPWQFMPATGRDFSLKQNIFRDDRRDVLASTRAALDYLERLNNMFGDWQLALAAYNWGQGNVRKAIARNQAAGLPTDFDNLRMPDETRYYLPKLQAVKNIVLRPDAYGLSLPPVANHPYFLSVRIDRDIDVELAARLAGLSLEAFQQLNPQMNKPVILAAGTPQVVLPYDNVETFANALAAHQGPLASWTAWVVPKTMKPADAAKQVGMSEAQLRDVNDIPPRMLVKQGSTLLVPRASHQDNDVSSHLADNASMKLAPDVPPLRTISIKAGKGDTLASLARRHQVSVAQLAQWNKLSTKASLKAGQTLTAYTSKPLATTAQATRNRASTKPREPARKPTSSKTASRGTQVAASGSARQTVRRQ